MLFVVVACSLHRLALTLSVTLASMGHTASNDRRGANPEASHSASASPYPVSPPSAPQSSCPFLVSFAKDASAQFSLCPYISFTDLASLNQSCRSWRAWMLFPPAVACGSNGGGRHWSRFTSTSLVHLSNCPWARGLLTELRANPERRSKEAQKSDAEWDRQQNQQAMTILQTLPCFPNLECLRLIPSFCESANAVIVADVIRSTFAALPRLVRLKLSLDHGRFRSQSSALPLLMAEIDHLRFLRELTIDGWSDVSSIQAVSFDRLLFCPSLRRLEFTIAQYTNGAEVTLLLSQVSSIAQCTQIEWLSCKAWHMQGPDPALALRRFVEMRLAAQEANRRGSGSSAASDGKPLLPVRTLMHLDLRTTDLRSDSMLPLLAQFPGLTDISPRFWTARAEPLPNGEWNRSWEHLAAFTQLRILRLDAGMYAGVEAGLDTILSHLGRCGTLQQLTLDSLALSESQMQSIVRRCPALHTLVLIQVRFDSLDALSDAPALTSLSLRQCVLPPLPRVSMRGMVPRLPELLRLSIVDTEYLRITAAKAAPLNRALMERCPKLSKEKFEQNLAWS